MCPANVAVASTLAWLAASKKYIFDLYYDSYHLGLHFQGGDWRALKAGQLTGGTVIGGRHFEEFYFLLQHFDVTVAATGPSMFLQTVHNLRIPVRAYSDQMNVLYRSVFQSFNEELPKDIVMIGGDFIPSLAGLEAFLYPDIYYRRALGVSETISEQELEDLCGENRRIACVCVSQSRMERLSKAGYDLEILDQLREGDDYRSVTHRTALRWKDRAKGWIIGDPTLISHWIPTACEQDLISIYSIPQRAILSDLEPLISSTSNVVFGRQYDDTDFFELSRMNQALQVIDPCRPPFQSVRHIEQSWAAKNVDRDPREEEFTDEQLHRFAAEGRILVSLIFWTGMIREVENFFSLMDLVCMTGLRCGMVITAQTCEYMKHAPLELLSVPFEQGGVFPLVELLMGSCGIGVGIEKSFAPDRLADDLRQSLNRMRETMGGNEYLPQGWWPTMDAPLEALSWFEKPLPIRLMRCSPYLQIRFHLKSGTDLSPQSGGRSKAGLAEQIKSAIRKSRFMKHFEPYRPFEFYKPGARTDQRIIDAVKAAGLKYMFTKAAFQPKPAIPYADEEFIALNYTAGQWDGWTPFETVNDVTDLRKAERRLIRTGEPGWIASTIDSCLWTFSGEFWKRGSRLLEIASFCAQGGRSGKLINAKPVTLSRYARIISKLRGTNPEC
jgi:hypothetical protein